MSPLGLELLGIQLQTVLAGFSGSACHMLFAESMGTSKVLVVTASSTVIAIYAAPFLAELFNLGVKSENGLAFFIGMSSMEIMPGLLKAAAKASEDPLAFLDKWRGK